MITVFAPPVNTRIAVKIRTDRTHRLEDIRRRFTGASWPGASRAGAVAGPRPPPGPSLLDHSAGGLEKVDGDLEPRRLGGLHVDRDVEPLHHVDGHRLRLLALQDLRDL